MKSILYPIGGIAFTGAILFALPELMLIALPIFGVAALLHKDTNE